MEEGLEPARAGPEVVEIAKPHPEVMAICVAGALTSLLSGQSGDASGPADLDERLMERPLHCACGTTHKGLSHPPTLLSFVRSLLIEQLHLSSDHILVMQVIVESMAECGVPIRAHSLRPVVIAASIVAVKLCSDDPDRRSLASFGEPLPLLAKLEVAALCSIGWRISIDEDKYAAASARLLDALDTSLQMLRSPLLVDRGVSPTSTMDASIHHHSP